MCSELFRIPYSWGGVPIFGFGLLLAVWAVVSAVSMVVATRRHGWGAETWSLVPIVLLTGAAIVGLPRLFPGGLPIRGYGLMVLVGAGAGIAMATYRARRAGLDHELIWSLAIWLFVGGMIGARLFYVVEYWDERFRSDSLRETVVRVLDFPEGGLVIYGGFFGAAAAALAFLRKHRLPLLATADLIAPSMAVGLALGRIGCLLNGCCYGGISTLPWAVTFPPSSPPYMDQLAHGDLHGFRLAADENQQPLVAQVYAESPAADAGLKPGDRVLQINGARTSTLGDARDGVRQAIAAREPLALGVTATQVVKLPAVALPSRSRPVHPTQIYSSITAGLLGWFLWSYYPLRRRDGEVLALLVSIYPVSRFLLETIRTDEPAVFGTGLSISQNISIGLLVLGIGLWFYLSRQPRGVAWPVDPSPQP